MRKSLHLPLRQRWSRPEPSDRGLAMLEAVLAIGIATLVAFGALSVSVALWNQTHLVERASAARDLALRIDRLVSGNCGVQIGTEPADVVASASTGCKAMLGLAPTDPQGDVTFDMDWRRSSYSVTVRSRWQRSADRASSASSCADLAASAPITLARAITVSWTSPNGTQRAYTAEFVEAAPADAPGYESIASGLVIDGLVAADAIDLQFVNSTGEVLRRYGTPLGSGPAGCAWFPFLPPGRYTVATLGSSTTSSVTVGAGAVTVVPRSSL